MATVDFQNTFSSPAAVFPTDPHSHEENGLADQSLEANRQSLHRIKKVREEQEMSLRSVARNLGADIRQLRIQEKESCDLRLSELFKWQKALNVPLVDLLVEPDSFLSRPVSERAQMVRIMKTAMSILDRADSPPMERLAKTLVDQLVKLMPELEDIGPWHEVGQRRSLDEYGRVMERRMSDDAFWSNESYD